MKDVELDESFDNLKFESSPEPTWEDIPPIDGDSVYIPEDEDDADDAGEQIRPSESLGPRESVSDLLAMGYTAAGGGLVKWGPTTVHASGRVMQLQAISAGETLDKLIAGTVVDRVLQRLVGVGGSLETFGALIAGPVLAGVISANPELGPKIAPMLMSSILTTMEDADRTMAHQAAAQAKKLKTMQRIAEQQGVKVEAAEESILGFIFQDIFSEDAAEEQYATVPGDEQ